MCTTQSRQGESLVVRTYIPLLEYNGIVGITEQSSTPENNPNNSMIPHGISVILGNADATARCLMPFGLLDNLTL